MPVDLLLNLCLRVLDIGSPKVRCSGRFMLCCRPGLRGPPALHHMGHLPTPRPHDPGERIALRNLPGGCVHMSTSETKASVRCHHAYTF